MAPRLRIGVRRSEDLLVLDFELVNLRLQSGVGVAPRFVPQDTTQLSYLLVHFPAQHIAEQAFLAPPGTDETAQAVMANPSLLVFDVTAAVRERGSLPFALDALLDWTRFALVVDPGLSPEASQPTAIEIPYRLTLAPDAAATWIHEHQIVAAEEDDAVWTELWHTRLATRPDDLSLPPRDALPGERSVVVTAARHDGAPDPELGPFAGPPMIPSSSDRLNIPRNSPIPVERLIMSSLGAWLTLHGRWSEGVIAEWQQITTMGRDQFAKIASRGFLFPFGHRAVRTIINERTIDRPAAAAEDVAYLHSRSFLTVVEPERDFAALSAFYPGTEGREMPFRRVRLVTLQTPEIDVAPGQFIPRVVVDGQLGEVFRFQLVGQDWDGNDVAFTMPLCFIAEDDLPHVAVGALDNQLVPHSEPSFGGQAVAFAPPAPGERTTTFPTHAVRFGSIGDDRLQSLSPPFLPRVMAATVGIPAVEQIAGTQPGTEGVRFAFSQAYLDTGFDPIVNAGQIFATFDTPMRVDIPREKSGGFLVPRPNFAGLSRALGPVSAGASPEESVEASLASLTSGTFDPVAVLGRIKILGTFELTELVAANVSFGVTELESVAGDLRDKTRQIEELRQRGDDAAQEAIRGLETEITAALDDPGKLIKVPLLTTHVHRANDVPVAVETQYLWKPQLAPPGTIAGVLRTTDTTQLVIRSTVLQRLSGGPPESRVTGALREFTLTMLEVLEVEFERLTFEMEIGQSPRVVPKIRNVSFKGNLGFVRQIAALLGGDLPFDLQLLPQAIVASYRFQVPTVSVGLFTIKNIALSTALTLPLVDDGAIGTRFALSEKRNPFLVSVWWFGGGGFFAIEVRSDGKFVCEMAIEAGAVVAIDVVVASGEVHAFFGIYFKLDAGRVTLEGYFRIGGSVTVLAIASVSIEAGIKLSYTQREVSPGVFHDVVGGTAWVELCVEVAFFSKCVGFSVTKEFTNPPSLRGPGLRLLPDGADAFAAPLANQFQRDEWQKYVRAFG